ncbi:MAG: nascent polypeptide-associated complex protein [Candidatus Nanohaloarchaea archaeon]
MFGGNMQQMMKQMGMDMDEINADKVEIHVGDKKMVFSNPEVKKIDMPNQGEMFNLTGNYSEKEAQTVSEEDIELVVQKTDCSEEEARQALQESEDVAEAVMEVQ